MLVDVYCKIIPLDDEYVAGHHGQMQADVDGMLASKGMTASQYLTSCYESTKAPLVEFILRSTDLIGRQYMEEADATLKDAQENEINIPEPKDIDPEDKKIEDQIVDIKEDPEYETFIDKLKKKTIDKIVNDVSKIINDKKEEKKMTFDTASESSMESVVTIGMDYLQKKLWENSQDLTESQQEEMIGLAIREATLNEMDLVFNMGGSINEYATRIRFGRGYVINESAVTVLKESVQKEDGSTTYTSDELKKMSNDDRNKVLGLNDKEVQVKDKKEEK
jgi:hypothetical protein